MDKFLPAFLKYFLIVLSFAAIAYGIVALVKFYNNNFTYNMMITIRFTELDPVCKNMPVYYKGCKIGKEKDIIPSSDYKHSLMRVILYPKNLYLPKNTTAKVEKNRNECSKKESVKSYINLVYPEEPSKEFLVNGSIIEGHRAMDFEAFLEEQSESGKFDAITENAATALSNIGDMATSMADFFDQLTATVKENRPNIKKTTESTAKAAENLNQMSSKLKDSVDQEKISGSVSNIEQATKNINKVTGNMQNIIDNIDSATKKLDKTMDKVDCTVAETQAAATNIKCITKGISELLNKRFAGMRILFGKPLPNGCGCATPCPKPKACRPQKKCH